MPLVGGEVQRIDAALRRVSLELSALLTQFSALDLDGVGTPACDVAVAQGCTDLGKALTGLEQMSQECLRALSRHREFAEPDPVDRDPGSLTRLPLQGGRR